jgi:hypothetical protein
MKRKISSYRGAMAEAETTEEHRSPTDAIDGLADYLRRTFYMHLQFYVDVPTPGRGEPPAAERKAWRRLAEHLASKLIPPEEFLLAQFPYIGEGSRPWIPRTPHQLQSARCIQRYNQYAEDPRRLEEIRLSLRLQMERGRQGIIQNCNDGDVSVADSCIRMLRDDQSFRLGSLVRYCLAHGFAEKYPEKRTSFDRIAENLKGTAVVEYITNRRLVNQTPLKRLLPKDFVENASQLYRDIYFRRPDAQ